MNHQHRSLGAIAISGRYIYRDGPRRAHWFCAGFKRLVGAVKDAAFRQRHTELKCPPFGLTAVSEIRINTVLRTNGETAIASFSRIFR